MRLRGRWLGLRRRPAAWPLALYCIACGGHATAPAAPKQLQILNYLYVAATVTVDGVAYGSVTAGNASQPGSVVLTLPGSAKTLVYALSPFVFADGSPIPRDLVGETLTIPATDATLGINNIVNGTPYFMVYFTNSTSQTVDAAVAANGQVRCLVKVAPSIFGTKVGYFELGSTTEFRYYKTGTNCTGTYRVWSRDVLASYDANTGWIWLNGTIAP